MELMGIVKGFGFFKKIFERNNKRTLRVINVKRVAKF